MTSRLDLGERENGYHSAASPARADEAVSHGRAHLDYQRRIAAESVHRLDARAMPHGHWASMMEDYRDNLRADGPPRWLTEGGP